MGNNLRLAQGHPKREGEGERAEEKDEKLKEQVDERERVIKKQQSNIHTFNSKSTALPKSQKTIISCELLSDALLYA